MKWSMVRTGTAFQNFKIQKFYHVEVKIYSIPRFNVMKKRTGWQVHIQRQWERFSRQLVAGIIKQEGYQRKVAKNTLLWIHRLMVAHPKQNREAEFIWMKHLPHSNLSIRLQAKSWFRRLRINKKSAALFLAAKVPTRHLFYDKHTINSTPRFSSAVNLTLRSLVSKMRPSMN